MPRAILDDPDLRPSDTPASELEAFVWMLAQAAWRDHTVFVGNREIRLRRGQLAYSLRYLAKAWRWDVGRVRRFLERLTTRHRIDTQTDTGVTVITICDYEKIQRSQRQTDTEAAQEPTQIRNKEQPTNKRSFGTDLRADGAEVVRIEDRISTDRALKALSAVIPDDLARDYLKNCQEIGRPLSVERAEQIARILGGFSDPIGAVENAIISASDYVIDPDARKGRW